MSAATTFTKEQTDHFIIETPIEVKELSLTLTKARCKKSGATIIHLKNDDPEKLFCISLPTYPNNSRGTPHILEHTVLCGCKKYPVKDPFFYMLRRSMNTFMNAFTGSDFTCYPAASLVNKDFQNLFDVYFSSVFHPLLSHESFLQEGFRLIADTSQARLTLKRGGIVFNEMKGAYQNPQSLLWRKLQQSLFAGGTYGVDSGGDPLEIPKITHEELKKFHTEFYHPSRAIFYFYGDLSFSTVTTMLKERLSDFKMQKISSNTFITGKKPSTAKISVDKYPADASSNTVIAAAAWEVAEISETEKVLQLALVDQLLMGHDGSCLKKRLLENSLVDSCDSHLDCEMRQVPYALCFYTGVEPEKRTKHQTALASLLQSSLEEIIKEGFSKQEIDAALHQLRLQFLDISSSSYPLGLTLFFRIALPGHHGIDPEETLKIHTHLRKLATWASNPSNILATIQKHLINQSPFWQVLHPDAILSTKASQVEEASLRKEAEQLEPDTLVKIRQDEQKLKDWQQKNESAEIEKLPLLDLSAISPVAMDIDLQEPLKQDGTQQIQSLEHRCFTNSFVYSRLQFVNTLPLQDSAYIAASQTMFRSRALGFWSELGTGNSDYSIAGGEIEASCQELYAQEKLLPHLDGSVKTAVQFNVSGLHNMQSQFLPLLKKHLLHKRFDETARIDQLKEQHIQEVLTSIADLGYGFAKSASSRMFNNTGAYLDHVGGLCSLSFAFLMQKKAYSALFTEALPSIYASAFEKYIETVKNPTTNSRWISTLEKDATSLDQPIDIREIQELTTAMQSETSRNAFKQLTESCEKALNGYDQWSRSFGFVIPSEVAFNAMSLYAPYSYEDPRSAYTDLAAAMMSHLYLHTHIREKGGAYGSGCHFDIARSALTFQSYRDPHVMKTFVHFENAIEFLTSGNLQEQSLHEAKLKVLQSLDQPTPPSERAFRSDRWDQTGFSHNIRCQYKKTILQASLQDITNMAQELQKSSQIKGPQRMTRVSFASESLLKNAQETLSAVEPFELYDIKAFEGLLPSGK